MVLSSGVPSSGAYAAPARTNATDEAATQRWLEQQAVHPANLPSATRTNPTDEAATQQWLQQQAAPAPPAAAPAAPRTNATDEAATQRWLQQQIEDRNAVNPERAPEPIYQEVERTVYVDRPVYYRGCDPYGYGYSYDYDSCGRPVYEPRYYGYRRGTDFPINTALGAGLGAIIGNQSHRSGRGAAIGAGIGLLFDLGRWVH
ncbi:MAG TPA: YMGG-like glycine zipper-containing protein [Planctomycetota bacterium]|nr:YMGG-like glycine zipper-containing protein [Planctomycetota bacterium]